MPHSHRKSVKGPARSTVSTGKHTFEVDERVLCYEPDVTKAKVLYDAKVLQVAESKDCRGRRRVQYKIHFQGWNSTWDRFVSEHLVLKDNEKNRALQEELRMKAMAAMPPQKKKRKTIAELVREVSQRRSEGGDDTLSSSSDDSDDDVDPEVLTISLPDDVRHYLADDYVITQNKGFRLKHPAKYPVLNILEEYVKNFGYQELAVLQQLFLTNDTVNDITSLGSHGKTSYIQSSFVGSKGDKSAEVETGCTLAQLQKALQKIQVCKEVTEGFRVLFDFYVNHILLYKNEKEFFEKSGLSLSFSESRILFQAEASGSETVKKGASTGSCAMEPAASTSKEGKYKNDEMTRLFIKNSSVTMKDKLEQCISHLMRWTLRKANTTGTNALPLNPSSTYSVIHLLRFCLKVPRILELVKMPLRKFGAIVFHLNGLLKFLCSRKKHVFDFDSLYIRVNDKEEVNRSKKSHSNLHDDAVQKHTTVQTDLLLDNHVSSNMLSEQLIANTSVRCNTTRIQPKKTVDEDQLSKSLVSRRLFDEKDDLSRSKSLGKNKKNRHTTTTSSKVPVTTERTSAVQAMESAPNIPDRIDEESVSNIFNNRIQKEVMEKQIPVKEKETCKEKTTNNGNVAGKPQEVANPFDFYSPCPFFRSAEMLDGEVAGPSGRNRNDQTGNQGRKSAFSFPTSPVHGDNEDDCDDDPILRSQAPCVSSDEEEEIQICQVLTTGPVASRTRRAPVATVLFPAVPKKKSKCVGDRFIPISPDKKAKGKEYRAPNKKKVLKVKIKDEEQEEAKKRAKQLARLKEAEEEAKREANVATMKDKKDSPRNKEVEREGEGKERTSTSASYGLRSPKSTRSKSRATSISKELRENASQRLGESNTVAVTESNESVSIEKNDALSASRNSPKRQTKRKAGWSNTSKGKRSRF